jgi:signal transduction histidine kinase
MRPFPLPLALFRRLTPLTLALAAMAILLGVLAVLQYRWVGQLSADERDRLRAHVSVQADSLSDDFNRELTRAFFWLQFGAEIRRDTPLETDTDRYIRWYSAAPRPELIKTIYRVTEPAKDGEPWVLDRFVREPAGLETVAWPAELEPLRAAMEDARRARGRADKQPLRVPATWAGVPALVIPRIVQVDEHHEGGRMLSMVTPAHGYTIAVLDAAVIKHDLLPQLVERHFKLSEDPTLFVGVYGPGGFAYTAPEGPVPMTLQTAPDIKQGDLFEVRFREFTRFVADRRLTPAVGTTTGSAAPGGAGPTPLPPPPGGPPQPIVIARDDRGNAFRIGGPGGPGGPSQVPHWQVHVLHRAGSFDAAVTSARVRNLLVSFGVLLLLGASMGLVVVTTGRARRLAAQQLEFVAGVSHELRTPLAVIRSAGENLADGVVADPKQIKRYGEVIAGEGRRLTHMVEQIMEFAGFESGRATLDVRPVAPGGLVEEALSASAPQVQEHHATIERTGAAELPVVLVDGGAVSRSLQNLIVNALKYGGTPPRLVVDVRPGDPSRREVDVTVSDNGTGIAARDLPHIFEPFYRGADARARQVHGSGLGLSLVKRIMDEMGGRVTVRTDAKGSAFTLHLPIAPEGARQPGPAAQGAPATT